MIKGDKIPKRKEFYFEIHKHRYKRLLPRPQRVLRGWHVAEGGTEYGHMITYARSRDIWGHGDLIQDKNGEWHIISLGFRQIHLWMPYHHLGREMFLTPVKFGDGGWFTAGNDGMTEREYEIAGDLEQAEKRHYTFENTDWGIDWCYLRRPHFENYELNGDKAILRGTDIDICKADPPTFIGIRQRDFDMELSADVSINGGEGGITVYMCENEHYDIAVRKSENGFEAVY